MKKQVDTGKEIVFPEDYRFDSEIDKFKRCVDIASELMKNNQMKILFGCVKNINVEVWLDEEGFNRKYKDLDYTDFINVLNNEVTIIIEQNLKSSDFEEPNLRKYLEDKIDTEMISKIIELKYEKRKYVQKQMLTSEIMQRYMFKQRTLNKKLSSIRFEVNRYMFGNDSDMMYSTIEIGVTDRLGDDMISDFLNVKKSDDYVRFVCDKQDLEYIIECLTRIKERL